jgi:hypothetical protein
MTFICLCIAIHFHSKPTICTSFWIYLFWVNTLHVLEGLSVHHSNRYCYLLANKQIAVSVWHTPVAVCKALNSWRWTERLSETCRVLTQNKYIERLVHLVGLLWKSKHLLLVWFTTFLLLSSHQNDGKKHRDRCFYFNYTVFQIHL